MKQTIKRIKEFIKGFKYLIEQLFKRSNEELARELESLYAEHAGLLEQQALLNELLEETEKRNKMQIAGIYLDVYHEFQIEGSWHDIEELKNARKMFDLELEQPDFIDIWAEDDSSDIEEQILEFIPIERLETGFYLIEYEVYESQGYFDLYPEAELDIQSVKPISEEKLKQILLKEKLKSKKEIKNQLNGEKK
jgi:hypothetical protein